MSQWMTPFRLVVHCHFTQFVILRHLYHPLRVVTQIVENAVGSNETNQEYRDTRPEAR